MAWIRVTERFSWKATPATTIVYKPGEYNVPAACATLAVAANKAVRLRKSNKDEPSCPASEPEQDNSASA